MEAEYKRDYNRNYLILHDQTNLKMESYPVRMLLANVIPCLLSCRQQTFDGEPYFYFDITSRQSVSACYEKQKFREKDLELLFSGIVQAAEQMAAFLMNPDQLCLEPEYVYMEPEKKQLLFCCFPGRQARIQDQFRNFAEYLLPKIDHEDARAVAIGYGIYRKSMEEGFHLDQVMEELYTVKKDSSFYPQDYSEKENGKKDFKEEKEIGTITDTNNVEELFQIENIETGKSPAETEFIRKGMIMMFLSAAVLAGIAVARGMGYFSILNIYVLFAGSFIIGSFGILLNFFQKKCEKKKNEPILPMKEKIIKGEYSDESIESEDKTRLIRFETHVDLSMEKNTTEDTQEDTTVGITEDLNRPVIKKYPVLKNQEPGDLEDICLKEELTVIGKLPAASDIVLSFSTVSRIHAKIQKKDGKYYLTDLNSRNGTLLNGVLLKSEEIIELHDQDLVQFGELVYIFQEN